MARSCILGVLFAAGSGLASEDAKRSSDVPKRFFIKQRACATVLPASAMLADDAPGSYVASADVYRVIAENEKTKVILATWKAGQRDNWHSHPATGVYFLTNCESRIYTPDGKFTDAHQKEGGAVVQAPIPSHSSKIVEAVSADSSLSSRSADHAALAF